MIKDKNYLKKTISHLMQDKIAVNNAFIADKKSPVMWFRKRKNDMRSKTQSIKLDY